MYINPLERHLPCGNGRTHVHRERLLVGRLVGNAGYIQVTLTKGLMKRFFYAHRLVLLTFVGPCPAGMEACHTNDNPTDNRLVNLRWDTRLANMADRDKRGGTLKGEAVGGSKLTATEVRDIRASPDRRGTLAAHYGVTAGLIDQIRSRRVWRHIR